MQEALTTSRKAVAVISAAAILSLLALAMGTAKPPAAHAGACMVIPYHSYGGGVLVLGPSECGDSNPTVKEAYSVFCHPDGNVHSFYVYDDPPGNEIIDGPCGEVSGIVINGEGGPDTIDSSAVNAGGGFTGLRTIDLNGGDGADVIKARNGRNDDIDCGDGIDSAQSDQLSLDKLSNCELVDAVAEPTQAVAAAAPAAATAVAARCKKRRSATAAKKKRCKKPKKH